MLFNQKKYSVEEILAADATRWDRRMAADLAAELESRLDEKADTLPEMRRILAVKGYRELRARLQLELGNARGMRPFGRWRWRCALSRMNVQACRRLTFRSSIIDSPEWRRESELLGGLALRAFESAGLCREQAMEALRILRALVRGFVLHEMSQSFLEDVDYDESYSAAVDVFIRGLDVLRSAQVAPREPVSLRD
jgi:hypothetical protein